MPRITALSTLGFADYPLSFALEQIQARGFRAVELVQDGSRCRHFKPGVGATEAMRVMLRATFLQPVALDCAESDLNRLRAVIKQCRSLGIVKLNVVPAASGENARRDAEINTAATVLSDLAEFSLDNGVRLTVDAPSRTGLLDTVERAEQFYSRVASEYLGITIDTRHLSALNDLEELWRIAGPRIWHVRLDGRTIAGAATSATSHPRADPATPEDVLPLDELAALLDRRGYRGNVTVSLGPAGKSVQESGNEIDAALRRLASSGWQLPNTVQVS